MRFQTTSAALIGLLLVTFNTAAPLTKDTAELSAFDPRDVALNDLVARFPQGGPGSGEPPQQGDPNTGAPPGGGPSGPRMCPCTGGSGSGGGVGGPRMCPCNKKRQDWASDPPHVDTGNEGRPRPDEPRGSGSYNSKRQSAPPHDETADNDGPPPSDKPRGSWTPPPYNNKRQSAPPQADPGNGDRPPNDQPSGPRMCPCPPGSGPVGDQPSGPRMCPCNKKRQDWPSAPPHDETADNDGPPPSDQPRGPWTPPPYNNKRQDGGQSPNLPPDGSYPVEDGPEQPIYNSKRQDGEGPRPYPCNNKRQSAPGGGTGGCVPQPDCGVPGKPDCRTQGTG